MSVPEQDVEAAYVFDPADGALLGPLLDAACSDYPDPAIVASAFMHPGSTARETARDHALARGLSYELVADPTDPARSALHPLRTAESPWMTPLLDTRSEVLDLWEACLASVKHPVLRAHFHDLLFSAKRHRGLDAAQLVIDAYLNVSDPEVPFWMEGLARSISIARAFALDDAEASTRETLLRFAEARLSDRSVAGLVTHALELLSAPAKRASEGAAEEDRIRALFGRAWESIESNLPITDALAHANRRFAQSPDERRAVSEKHVQTYLRPDDPGEGVRRIWELTNAAHLAERYELPDLRQQAIAALQARRHDPLGGQTLGTPVTLPRWLVFNKLHSYRRSRDWRQSLQEWLLTEAPTGSWAHNQQRFGQTRPGLLSLVTRITIGRHGLPERSRSGPDARALDDLHAAEQGLAQMNGTVLARALDIIGNQGRDLSEGVLSSFLLGSNTDEQLTVAFSHALMLFFEGRTSDAGLVAFPIVEAAARGALLLLDEPLYRLQAGQTPGHFPSLDIYIQALEEHGLDEDWVRTLRIVLTPEGFNLRNETAHGHKLTYTAVESALMLRIAGLLLGLNGPSSTKDSDAWAMSQRRYPPRKRRRCWRIMIYR